MALYLVTGGAGFIGSHLARLLLEKGHRVRILDNFSTGDRFRLKDLDETIEWVQADAESAEAALAFEGVDGVFHLAAISSVTATQTDLIRAQRSGEIATLHILTCAARYGVNRVVMASSAAVYGNAATGPLTEEMPVAPLSFYGASKATLEHYGQVAAGIWKQTDTVSLRFFNVYGHGQNMDSPYSGVISVFMNCLRQGLKPHIYGDGSQTRDFIHVEDVSQACLLAMEHPGKMQGAVYNVGTGHSSSIREIWETLRKIAGSNLDPTYGPSRPFEITYSAASVQKARQTFGFHAKIQIANGLIQLWSTVSMQ